MAEPSLTTSDPLDGAQDVFINTVLEGTFAAALDSSTITVNGVTLQNVATTQIVDVSVQYISATNRIRITPLSVLSENTVYRILFVGTDIAVSPSYVISDSATGDKLLTTISITFTTGSKIYIDDSAIDKNATDLSLEGDLVLPIHVKALGDFAVKTTIPLNHAYDVSTDLDGQNRVAVIFNQEISGALCADSWLTVDVYPMLDTDQYLATDTTLGAGTIPTMTGLTCSGDTIYANFDTAMPKNCGVEIMVNTGVISSDGDEFGPSDYLFSFTTDRYPKISGVHSVEREIKAATDELNRDYIAALLLSNTIRLLERTRTTFTGAPTWPQLRWVLLRTIVDILDDKELEKALVDGTRRQLGDFNVSIDTKHTEAARLALKHARALKDLELIEKTLVGRGLIAVRYDDTRIIGNLPDRLWHGVVGKLVDSKWKSYQPNLPAANINVNRLSKTPPAPPWS